MSSIFPDSRDVEECASDTYLRVWNSIPPQRPQRLDSFLARIARNAALDRYDYNTAGMRKSNLALAYEALSAGKVRWCSAKVGAVPGGQGKIIWFDVVPGILYSLTMDSGASEEALLDLAEQLFEPVQDYYG